MSTEKVKLDELSPNRFKCLTSSNDTEIRSQILTKLEQGSKLMTQCCARVPKDC